MMNRHTSTGDHLTCPNSFPCFFVSSWQSASLYFSLFNASSQGIKRKPRPNPTPIHNPLPPDSSFRHPTPSLSTPTNKPLTAPSFPPNDRLRNLIPQRRGRPHARRIHLRTARRPARHRATQHAREDLVRVKLHNLRDEHGHHILRQGPVGAGDEHPALGDSLRARPRRRATVHRGGEAALAHAGGRARHDAAGWCGGRGGEACFVNKTGHG